MAKLYFYYSAMNAGKTTVLLQSDYNYRERGMDTLLYTPAIDTRESFGMIASRIGLKKGAIPFDDAFNFFDDVSTRKSGLENLKCVLVDESHFMTKEHIQQLCAIVDELNTPVLAYGLRTDFKGEPFVASKYLLAWADNIVEIKTICHCGRKATMNQRIDEKGDPVLEGAQVEIGGNERYVSMCRYHFNHPDSKEIQKIS